MNQMYIVRYKKAGGVRIDEMSVWVSSFTEAINYFTHFQFEIGGYTFTMNESSIVSITLVE